MIYALGKVVSAKGTIGFFCADVDVSQISQAYGKISPSYVMLQYQQMVDALGSTSAQLVKKGYKADWANKFNKKSIVNLHLVNGVPSSEAGTEIPILDFQTRDILPNTARGMILAEYVDFDSKQSMGFCLALYNSNTHGFDVGRANTKALINFMQTGHTNGVATAPLNYRPISNADLAITNDGLLTIVPAATGYDRLEIVKTASQDALKKPVKMGLSKQESSELSKQRKVLGSTTVQMMKSVAEDSIGIVNSQDMFNSFTPEQVRCIQQYYMGYTKQIFECLKKTSRLDISPEKLAKLDSFRISQDTQWEYGGIIQARFMGQYKCALGHSLLRAHIARCTSVTDEDGKPLRLIFGSTCAADFFRIDSGDMPILKKTESVMVKEVSQFVQMMNDGKVDEGWKGVSLFRYFVDDLERQGKLDTLCSTTTVNAIREFRKNNLPYPKSLTELFLIDISYSKLDKDEYRAVLYSYQKRKRLEESSSAQRKALKSYPLFKAWLGEDVFETVLSQVPNIRNLFDIIILSKLQGVYGWDPDNQSTGFRGMHNEKMKKLYFFLTMKCQETFGVEKFTGEEMDSLRTMLRAYATIAKRSKAIYDTIESKYEGQAKRIYDKALADMRSSSLINMTNESAIVAAIVSPLQPERQNSPSTVLNVDLTSRLGYRDDSVVYSVISNYNVRRNYRALVEKGINPLQNTVQCLTNTSRVQQICNEFEGRVKKFTEDKSLLLEQKRFQDLKQELSMFSSIPLVLDISKQLYQDEAKPSGEGPVVNSISFRPGFFLTYTVSDNTRVLLTANILTGNGYYLVNETGSMNNPITHVITNSDTNVFTCLDYKIRYKNQRWQDWMDLGPTDEPFDARAIELSLFFRRIDSRYVRDVAEITIMNFDDKTEITLSAGYRTLVSKQLDFAKMSKKELIEFVLRKTSFDQRDSVIRVGRKNESLTLLGDVEEINAEYNSKNDPFKSDERSNPFKVEIQDGPTFILSDLGDAKYESNLIRIPVVLVDTAAHKQLKSVINFKIDDNKIEGATAGLTDAHNSIVDLKIGNQKSFSTLYSFQYTKEGLTVTSTATNEVLEYPSENAKTSRRSSTAANKTSTSGNTTAQRSQTISQATVKQSNAPVYGIRSYPASFEPDNVLHALMWAYKETQLKYVTDYTNSVDKVLALGKPWNRLSSEDKKLINQELAYVVSLGKLDMSYFQLPFEINTFILDKDPAYEDLFEALRKKRKVLQEAQDKGTKFDVDESKSINILYSASRWGKMSKRQRPYVIKAEDLYEKVSGDTSLPKTSEVWKV